MNIITCPQCGNQTNDMQKQCLRCGYMFTFPNQNYQQQMPYNQQLSNYMIMQQYFEQQEKKKNARTFFNITCIIGIIGAILSAISVFAPFLKVSAMFQSISESLFSQSPADALLIIIWSVILLIFSLPNKRYRKSDGVVKFALGLIDIGLLIRLVYNINYNFNNSDWGGYTVSLSLSAGFYLMLIGDILSTISGLMLNHAYSNNYINQ